MSINIQEIERKINTKLDKTGGTVTGNLNVTGNINVTGDLVADKVHNPVMSDYAEYFPRGCDTEPGDIIMLDIGKIKENYILAIDGIGPVVGVHSDMWGVCLGGHKMPLDAPDNFDMDAYNIADFIPVGLKGRVGVKVMGECEIGDIIVASSRPGVGIVDNSCDDITKIVGTCVEKSKNPNLKRVLTLLR